MARVLIALLTAAALAIAAGTTGTTMSSYSSASDNAGSSFATAASYSTCPNTSITPQYVTGFESGRKGAHADIFLGFGSAAATAVQSTVVRTGAYALRASPAGAAGYYSWLNTAFPASATIRFALRFDTLPAANVQELFAVRSNGTGAAVLRFVKATNTLTFALSGASTTVTSASTVPITTGQWYVIDLQYDPSTTTHQLAWRLDGAAQPGASVAGSALATYEFQFGTKTTDTYTAYYDDLMITGSASHYPLGDGTVHALKPDGMGNLTAAGSNFTNDDSTPLGATSWQRLDESPLSTYTDYIAQNIVNSASYAEITFANTTETCIRAAMGYITFHSGANKSTLAKFLVYDGSTSSTIRDGDFNHTTGRDVAKPIAPATTWSQSALNGLVGRFGYWSGGANPLTPPLLDGALIEYEVPQ